MTALAPTLQSFFTSYLIGQRAASAHTISAYRDTFRMLLTYTRERTGIAPNRLDIADLNADMVAGFLTMLETDRANSARTRNARLAAIHSMFHHAALRHPEHAESIARVLAIPAKNTHQTGITYLTNIEVDALLAAPDRTTWTGRRDHLLILVMVTTGLRVSEITATTRADVSTDRHGAHIACYGKGRKTRITPLDPATAATLRLWLDENPGQSSSLVFNSRGRDTKMSTDAVAQRIALHATTASTTCRTLAGRNVTPHVMRHTCSMRMLAAGIDATTIALWLGHFSEERNLSRRVPFGTLVRRLCHTLCVLCALCMSVNHVGASDAVAEGRVDAGVGVLDGRGRRLVSCSGR